MRAMTGHPVFAWAYGRFAPGAEAREGTTGRRRSLLAGLKGRVVEIGAGTGLNLPHYPRSVSEVLAVEPDPHMFRRLTRAMSASQAPVRARRARAEALPVADGAADAVVCTLVLCSVPDPPAALAEARRVLRADGELRFYEHVRSADPRFAGWQERLAAPWGWFGAGCHPDRDIVAAIRAAGFEVRDLERFDVAGTALARPHVQGVAVRA